MRLYAVFRVTLSGTICYHIWHYKVIKCMPDAFMAMTSSDDADLQCLAMERTLFDKAQRKGSYHDQLYFGPAQPAALYGSACAESRFS